MIRIATFFLAACALVGIGAGAALLLAPDKLQLVVDASAESERAVPPPPAPDRTDEVLASVGALREALAAFATALDDAARSRGALRDRLDALARQLGEARAPEPESKPEPVIKRKSLAALLAERKRTDVRDEPTTWMLFPGHCRVGFDGVSTIHNFTARSDSVEGSFRLHFRQPDDQAGGTLRMRVTTLDSGNGDRDKEIYRHLAGDDGKADGIDCEIVSIAAPEGQRGDLRTATARVRFRIHGETHEFDAPLKLEFTSQRLLHVTGEATLRMSDFGIHPKAKLGLIKVDDEVTVWWDLYAEADHGKD